MSPLPVFLGYGSIQKCPWNLSIAVSCGLGDKIQATDPEAFRKDLLGEGLAEATAKYARRDD